MDDSDVTEVGLAASARRDLAAATMTELDDCSSPSTFIICCVFNSSLATAPAADEAASSLFLSELVLLRSSGVLG